MMLRCAIVDDEPLALGLLESYVNKTPFLQLAGKYSSAVQAMKELPGEEVDLLFLDIQMPELNGLEFSKMVDSAYPYRIYYRFRTVCHRRLSCQCTRLSAETDLIRRFPASSQQSPSMVRTGAEAGRDRQYLCKK